MSDFKSKRRILTADSFPASDTGIRVADALVLLEGSLYQQEILSALDIASITNDTINIPGAATLVNSVLDIDNTMEKFDLPRHYQDLVFVQPAASSGANTTDVEIEFDATAEGYGTFTAAPAYNAQGDFLEKTANMRIYAKNLITHSRLDLVYHNLEEVRSIYRAQGALHFSKYRILKDVEHNKYYYRALISPSRYRDYNIKVSVLVFLVAAHRLMQQTGQEYFLNRAEYTDSEILAYFEKSGQLHRTPLGEVKFLLELRNNEIKEGSVKFSGICALVLDNNNQGITPPTQTAAIPFEEFENEYATPNAANTSPTQDIYLAPRSNRLRYNIEAIRHNVNPINAFPRMLLATKVAEVEQLLYQDLDIAYNATTLEQIRALIESKVNALAASSFLGAYKLHLKNVVPQSLRDVESLLQMVGNLNRIIPGTNANAQQMLRRILFEAIVERRRRDIGQTDNEGDTEQ